VEAAAAVARKLPVKSRRPRPKAPTVPLEQSETSRHRIAALLVRQCMSARDLAVELGLREKEVVEHLDHLRRSRVALVVTPAACRECGFVFRKRDRLSRPSRCPMCRGEQINEPLFEVEPER